MIIILQQITVASAFLDGGKKENRFTVFRNQQFFQFCQVHRPHANSVLVKVIVSHNRDGLGSLCSTLIIPNTASRCPHGIGAHDAIFCIGTGKVMNLRESGKKGSFLSKKMLERFFFVIAA